MKLYWHQDLKSHDMSGFVEQKQGGLEEMF